MYVAESRECTGSDSFHFSVYRALLSLYRALWSLYRALLSVHRSLLSVYRSLLTVYRALLSLYMALLWTLIKAWRDTHFRDRDFIEKLW